MDYLDKFRQMRRQAKAFNKKEAIEAWKAERSAREEAGKLVRPTASNADGLREDTKQYFAEVFNTFPGEPMDSIQFANICMWFQEDYKTQEDAFRFLEVLNFFLDSIEDKQLAGHYGVEFCKWHFRNLPPKAKKAAQPTVDKAFEMFGF